MNELALFAGAGGGILGGHLLGWTTVAACEIEPYPRAVLLHNQELGNLPNFPIWDDIRTFDGKAFRGHIDIVTGGFPCQDISAAGKGAGITGTCSGLWSEMHRIICEVQPRYAFMENSPMLTSRGLGRVLGDLAEAGYHAAWCVLGAADCGAPHRRDRIWVLAEDSRRRDVLSHTELHGSGRRKQLEKGSPQETRVSPLDSDTYGMQCPEQRCEHERTEIPAGSGANRVESKGDVADPTGIRLQTNQRQPADLHPPREHRTPDRTARNSKNAHASHADLPGCKEQRSAEPAGAQLKTTQRCSWWSFEPRVGRVAHGLASRVDRLKALGNGQVPLVAATAFQILKQRLDSIHAQ